MWDLLTRRLTKRELATLLVALTLFVVISLGAGLWWGHEQEKERHKARWTTAIQTVVMGALEAYHEEAHSYPPGDTQSLIRYLTGNHPGKSLGDDPAVLAADPWLHSLARGAFDANLTVVLDGWGRPIRYIPDGGPGRKPLLISAGPDGDFGDTDPRKARDNIRTDRE